jgi:hypothetical protein
MHECAADAAIDFVELLNRPFSRCTRAPQMAGAPGAAGAEGLGAQQAANETRLRELYELHQRQQGCGHSAGASGSGAIDATMRRAATVKVMMRGKVVLWGRCRRVRGRSLTQDLTCSLLLLLVVVVLLLLCRLERHGAAAPGTSRPCRVCRCRGPWRLAWTGGSR